MSASNMVGPQSSEKFIQAVKIGDLNKAKLIFDSSYLTIHDKFGLYPIHWACLNNYVNILKWLLKKKCPIDTKAKSGWRPIHMACMKNHTEIIEMLIKNNCDMECATDDGQTPLDIVQKKSKAYFFYDDGAEENNKKIADVMGLKCEGGCDHRFCSLSVSYLTFKKDDLIGSAEFAKVFRLKESQTDRIFAVKVIQTDSNENVIRESKYIEENINVYREFMDHDNVIKYFGVIRPDNQFYLFMEYMDKGSLKDLIERKGALPMNIIGNISKQVLQALVFLHRNKVIHRNIKATNILMDRNDKVKLTDFGSSGLLRTISHQYAKIGAGTQAQIFCRTAQYMSPELMRGDPYHYGSDIWSMGATVIEMLTGHPPYHNLDPAVVINKIGKAEIVQFNKLPGMNKDLNLFLEKMFRKNTEEREAASELLNSPFIKNVTAIITDKQLNRSDVYINRNKDRENRQDRCIEIVKNAINNKKIGLSMGLKCEGSCSHQFCLFSFATNKFPKHNVIANGAIGTIYKLDGDENGHKFAMKYVPHTNDTGVMEDMKTLVETISKYRDEIKHDRIIQYYGAIHKKHNILIFMEYVPGGSIRQFLKNNYNKQLPETSIINYTIQILEGLQYLHNNNVIHKNLKSTNILLTSDNNVKLIDYGLRQQLKGISKTNDMEFNYTSPEIINNEIYDFHTDIWSLGAVLVEMLTGHPPYHDLHPAEVVDKIGGSKKIQFQSPTHSSGRIEKSISMMVEGDPKKRPSAANLIKFMSSFN